ncbi:MAG: hypothetical protein M3077_15380 [Candidatus Dormibacteraeota bacterium]|nr:hypothetical protein [Candidatus Dormibacteraeota bacterium]
MSTGIAYAHPSLQVAVACVGAAYALHDRTARVEWFTPTRKPTSAPNTAAAAIANQR